MIELFNYKKSSTWLIWLIIYIIITNNNIEHFIYMPWNISTRFFPSYDIRGYPYIYPQYPLMYLTPYNFNASGDYTVSPIYVQKKKN